MHLVCQHDNLDQIYFLVRLDGGEFGHGTRLICHCENNWGIMARSEPKEGRTAH